MAIEEERARDVRAAPLPSSTARTTELDRARSIALQNWRL